ncbi:predicted protein [Streptomyces albidoflavus]|nr:predicted protein [Streptomyces albidoflavus]
MHRTRTGPHVSPVQSSLHLFITFPAGHVAA